MYIECKGGGFADGWGHSVPVEGGLTGPARIGRVTYSKTGATLQYRGRSFRGLKGGGFKSNFFDVDSGEHYWISGPKKNGQDSLYATNIATEIDEDVRDEYWTEVRKRPELKGQART